MGKDDLPSRIFHGLSGIGVAACAWRVLPQLWESNTLDSFVVGGSLGLVFMMMIHKALTGRWPS